MTDLHFGNKHNSTIFNQDIEDCINWFIAEAKRRNCETCVILGDWHHNRNTINVSTLNYTTRNLSTLSKNFENVYILTGNHDMYYREKRDIHSLVMGKELHNIHVVDEPLITGDVALIPWLVEDEWKKIVKIKSKYMFGHFEIPGFKMNAMIEMPDHGGINRTQFKNQDYVFSGHFHKRQSDKNIHYIGNPFGHNYGDAGDTDRGACFLQWGGKPEYVNYTDGPRYINVDLDKLLEDPAKYLNGKTYAKVNLNIDLSYEEASLLKDQLSTDFITRELKLVPRKIDDVAVNESDVVFESVDQIVINELSNIQSDTFNREKLIEIYNNL